MKIAVAMLQKLEFCLGCRSEVDRSLRPGGYLVPHWPAEGKRREQERDETSSGSEYLTGGDRENHT